MNEIQYQVLHRRRIKTIAGACNVLEHNLRTKFEQGVENESESKKIIIPDYLDQDAMKHNEYLGCQTRDEFCLMYQRKIDEAKLKRKIQRNASRVIETIISASHSFCKDWKTSMSSKMQIKRYLYKALEWEIETHGSVILSATYHWEETSPHLHVLSIPLIISVDNKTKEQKIKFSASEFFGGKGDLIAMHTDFYEKVGKKFGLQRGQYGSRASHRDLRDYKNWEESQREAFRQGEEKLLAEEKKIETQKISVTGLLNEVARQNQALLIEQNRIEKEKLELRIRQEGFEQIVAESKKDIPIIPEPPIGVTRSTFRTWLEGVQENISNTFQGIKAAYAMLVTKYQKAVAEINHLNSVNKSLQTENHQIKDFLINKPVSEIMNYREAELKKRTLELQRKERQRKDDGYSM